MSKFFFESYIEYEDGQMAHVYTADDKIPLNIHMDNADLFSDLHEGPCEIEVFGVTEKVDVFTSEEAYYASETHLAIPGLIPIGTLPLEGNEDIFKPSADILFSGKVLDIQRDSCAEEDEPDCCLTIETLGFEFSLYLRYEGEVNKGDIVTGRAWLYGEFKGKGSSRIRTHIASDSIDNKLSDYCGSYVRITGWNDDVDEGQIHDYTHRGDSDRLGFSFITGWFVHGGATFYYEDEIRDIELLEGTEADIVRGKITGDTIEEYLSLLNNEQISFISREFDINITDLTFIPKDKFTEIVDRIAEIECEEATADLENNAISARQRTAAKILSVWGTVKSPTGKNRK